MTASLNWWFLRGNNTKYCFAQGVALWLFGTFCKMLQKLQATHFKFQFDGLFENSPSNWNFTKKRPGADGLLRDGYVWTY